MSVRVICTNPHCRTKLRVDQHLPGRRIQCPACKQVFVPQRVATKPAGLAAPDVSASADDHLGRNSFPSWKVAAIAAGATALMAGLAALCLLLYAGTLRDSVSANEQQAQFRKLLK